MAQLSFHRIEKKFIVTEQQKNKIIEMIAPYMTLDFYCVGNKTYQIQNIYFDTENNSLISHSLEKPNFKQKMRARKYTGTNTNFLEIKKKSQGVVGKRRIALDSSQLQDFIENKQLPIKNNYIDNQIEREFQYFLSIYDVKPKVFISYDRLGFFNKDDKELRITFDKNIKARTYDLKFDCQSPCFSLLKEGFCIMEIKYNRNYPLWLVKILSSLQIKPGSFSKYGTEYKMQLQNGLQEVKNCV